MPDGNSGKPRDGEFEGRTYLYIRTHPADDGSEPLPAAHHHWVSPDITIIQPGGARGGEAVAGVTNHVEVVVTNAGGIEAVDAFVDVFFADPSTGITPATATLIGSGYITIPAYNVQAVSFPWIPSATDAGHRCLVARVALYLPPDMYVDGTIFDVRNDRHGAQRNISVVAMEDAEYMSFSFAVVNPLTEPMQMRLLAREARDEGELNVIREGLGCGFAQFGETPLPAVKIDMGDERIEVATVDNPLLLLAEEHRLTRSGALGRIKPTRLRNSYIADMQPGEIYEGILYVERNPDTRPGDLHAVNVIQQDADGNIIGGLTVIFRH